MASNDDYYSQQLKDQQSKLGKSSHHGQRQEKKQEVVETNTSAGRHDDTTRSTNPTIIASGHYLARSNATTSFLPSVGSVYFFGCNLHNLDGIDILSFVNEHNATLNFPQKLMLLLTYVDKEYAKSGNDIRTACISWVPDGHAFIIRDKQELTKKMLPLFFREGNKFPSFTRKLYRWGFRQTTVTNNVVATKKRKDDLIFGNEYFQRDNKSLLPKMRSITASSKRRQAAIENHNHALTDKLYPPAAAAAFAPAAATPLPPSSLSLHSSNSSTFVVPPLSSSGVIRHAKQEQESDQDDTSRLRSNTESAAEAVAAPPPPSGSTKNHANFKSSSSAAGVGIAATPATSNTPGIAALLAAGTSSRLPSTTSTPILGTAQNFNHDLLVWQSSLLANRATNPLASPGLSFLPAYQSWNPTISQASLWVNHNGTNTSNLTGRLPDIPPPLLLSSKKQPILSQINQLTGIDSSSTNRGVGSHKSTEEENKPQARSAPLFLSPKDEDVFTKVGATKSPTEVIARARSSVPPEQQLFRSFDQESISRLVEQKILSAPNRAKDETGTTTIHPTILARQQVPNTTNTIRSSGITTAPTYQKCMNDQQLQNYRLRQHEQDDNKTSNHEPIAQRFSSTSVRNQRDYSPEQKTYDQNRPTTLGDKKVSRKELSKRKSYESNRSSTVNDLHKDKTQQEKASTGRNISTTARIMNDVNNSDANLRMHKAADLFLCHASSSSSSLSSSG